MEIGEISLDLITGKYTNVRSILFAMAINSESTSFIGKLLHSFERKGKVTMDDLQKSLSSFLGKTIVIKVLHRDPMVYGVTMRCVGDTEPFMKINEPIWDGRTYLRVDVGLGRVFDAFELRAFKDSYKNLKKVLPVEDIDDATLQQRVKNHTLEYPYTENKIKIILSFLTEIERMRIMISVPNVKETKEIMQIPKCFFAKQ